jgi:threonine/homoserine/homoserine lactone efflux protein
MSDAFQILLSGVALGFSIAAPPGPVLAMAAQQVASRSWLAGWLVLLGATVADAIFFALTFYGVTTFVSPALRGFLFVVGGALMLYLALSTVRNARGLKAGETLSRPSRWATSGRSPFVMGLSVGLTNPFQLGWWVAIGAGMVAEYGTSIAVGFFAGILLWTVIFSALVDAGVARYERLAPVIAFASAAIMAGFGLWFLALGLLTTIL